jgi:hypothetical protein
MMRLRHSTALSGDTALMMLMITSYCPTPTWNPPREPVDEPPVTTEA